MSDDTLGMNQDNDQDTIQVDLSQTPLPLVPSLTPLQRMMASRSQTLGDSINKAGQNPESIPQASTTNSNMQLSPEQKAALAAANTLIAKELVQGAIDRFIPGAGYSGKLISGAAGIGAGYITATSQQQNNNGAGDQKK